MKRFLFAVATAALFASVSAAQEGPAVPVPAAPVVTGTVAGPVVGSATTTATTRRGLFGRIRGRSTPTTMAPAASTMVPTTGTVISPATPAVMPSTPAVPVPMPMPMPGTKTNPGAMVMPAAPDGIVLVGGTMTGTSMSGTVMTASASEPAATRRGLFGRLRNR